MSTATEALTIQMLQWISERPRVYAEVLDAWHTTCPRLSIWEDACGDGLIDCDARQSRRLGQRKGPGVARTAPLTSVAVP